MRPVLTVAEMRSVDAEAQREIPLSALIARAGAAVAAEAISLLGGAYGKRVVVVAGGGNNGNDGRVAAHLLRRRGAGVVVVAPGEVLDQGDRVDLLIDAAFGTGFRGDYEAPDPGGAPVLAVDIPTGLNADTGAAGSGAVRAARTVTFGAWKPGLLLDSGPDLAGSVEVRPIGLPVEGRATVHLVEDADVAGVPPRARSGHKWNAAVMVVAGSPGMFGAATFAAAGAGRAGAGMVRLNIPGADLGSLPVTSAVARSMPAENFDAVAGEELGQRRFGALVVGPGLGTASATAEAVCRLVASAPIPVVIDADGLTALGDVRRASEVIAARKGAPVVLTPHDGEFARLAGTPPGVDRIGAARRLSEQLGAVVLLKGSTTVVAAPGGSVLLAAAGSSRLATAGTGDVLSGVIGAFLARGVEAPAAAALAAHVHGRAAGLGRPEGLLAEDLPELVADVLSAFLGEASGETRRPGQSERRSRG